MYHFANCGGTSTEKATFNANKNQGTKGKTRPYQEDLVKKVGARRETILYMEKGKYNPSLKLVHEVAKALKTTINDLSVFDDENNK